MENHEYDPCRKQCQSDCLNYPELTTDLNMEPFRGSFQQLLNENIGKLVTVEITMSTCEIRALTGYIEQVSGRYVVLRTPKSNCRVVGDAWSIKALTFPCCD